MQCVVAGCPPCHNTDERESRGRADWQRYARGGQARGLTGQVVASRPFRGKKAAATVQRNSGIGKKSAKFRCEPYMDWEGRRVVPADPLQNVIWAN